MFRAYGSALRTRSGHDLYERSSPSSCARSEGQRQAVFNLNCPSGPIELRENFGFSWPEVNRQARLLQTHVQPLCAAWKAIHGNY